MGPNAVSARGPDTAFASKVAKVSFEDGLDSIRAGWVGSRTPGVEPERKRGIVGGFGAIVCGRYCVSGAESRATG